MNTVQKAESILSEPTGQLGRVLQRAKEIATLDQLVKKYLNETLSIHCQVCNLKNGRLIILAHSGAYATQLKYEIPTLLSKLRKIEGFENLSGIDYKVSPKITSSS